FKRREVILIRALGAGRARKTNQSQQQKDEHGSDVFRKLLKNPFRPHSERSEESLFDQHAKKREIPHFADSIRNDEFEISQQTIGSHGFASGGAGAFRGSSVRRGNSR